MAMRGSGGGGYGSRPHVEKSVRTGGGSKSTRPAGVSQIGYQVGDHTPTALAQADIVARNCTVPPSAISNPSSLATKLR
jgi:hypothetical protein